MVRLIICLVSGVCIWIPALSLAQTPADNTMPPANTIVIKNHQFTPNPFIIPAHQKVQITVDNQDPTAEEFESSDLDREQVVGGGKQITVYIGPLNAGTYKYWGDFHQDTTKGVIVAQ